MGKLFFFGDSITAGAWDTLGGWAARVCGNVMDMTMEALDSGSEFYCMPYNLGVSGNSIPDLLARLDDDIRRRVNPDDPDEPVQLVFAIGANDSVWLNDEGRPLYTSETFEKNLKALTDRSQKWTKNISFIGLMPVEQEKVDPCPWAPDKSYKNECVRLVEDQISAFCQGNGYEFLPVFESWSNVPDYPSLLYDGLHPNSKGHEKMAGEISEFLMGEHFIQFHSCAGQDT